MRTVNQILSDLKDKFQSVFTTLRYRTGSVILTLLEGFSLTLADLYLKVEEAKANFYIQTAVGDFLDKRAEDFGLFRKQGEKATNPTVTFSRQVAAISDIPIPEGTTFATPPDAQGGRLNYLTTEDGVLTTGNTSVNIAAIASETGESYNISAGEPLEITSSLDAIDSVSISTSFSGGTNTESDDELRERLKLFIASLGKATKQALRSTALNVAGVRFAKVVESGTNDGIVTMYIDDGGGGASSTLINQVRDAEENTRAAGIILNIYGVNRILINVTGTIVLEDGYTLAPVLSLVISRVTNFLNSLDVGENVIYAQIFCTVTSTEGVKDVNNLLVNSGTSNIIIANNSVAKAGSIGIS